MVRLLFALLISLACINPVFSDKEEEQIKIAFSSEVDSIAGFSESEVRTISKVNNITQPKKIEYDANSRAYIMQGNLYAYVQIFTTNSVRVDLQLKPFVPSEDATSNVSMKWGTSNAISVYENGSSVSKQISSDDGPVTVFQDGVSDKPRVKSWQIVPVLAASEVNSKAGTIGSFEASIVVSLYTTQQET